MRFSEIIGQERAKSILLGSIKANRIPHSMLFSGISGTGKKSIAKALAMLLNCLDPKGEESCGVCKYCKQLLSGNFPDFIIISNKTKLSKISIDQIREVYKRVSFSPYAKYRVIVIDQAENMTEEAANSFLKLLEEPPDRNIFILNVKEPMDLLPTIVSRCQNIKFYPIPSDKIAEWLVKNKSLDKDTAIFLAKISGGSIGRALELLESDYLKKREEWISLLVKLPLFSMNRLISVLENQLLEQKEDIMDILATWESWLRDILVIKETDEKDMLINRDLSYIAEKIKGRYKMEDLLYAISFIHEAEQALQKNRNIGLVLRNTLMSLYKMQREGK